MSMARAPSAHSFFSTTAAMPPRSRTSWYSLWVLCGRPQPLVHIAGGPPLPEHQRLRRGPSPALPPSCALVQSIAAAETRFRRRPVHLGVSRPLEPRAEWARNAQGRLSIYWSVSVGTAPHPTPAASSYLGILQSGKCGTTHAAGVPGRLALRLLLVWNNAHMCWYLRKLPRP